MEENGIYSKKFGKLTMGGKLCRRFSRDLSPERQVNISELAKITSLHRALSKHVLPERRQPAAYAQAAFSVTAWRLHDKMAKARAGRSRAWSSPPVLSMNRKAS